MSEDPSGKFIRKMIVIGSAAGVVLSAGWGAKAYVDSITDNVLSHVDAIGTRVDEVKKTVDQHTDQLEGVKRHDLSKNEFERWGYQLEKGNRSLLNASGQPGGLYVPPVPNGTEQAGPDHP